MNNKDFETIISQHIGDRVMLYNYDDRLIFDGSFDNISLYDDKYYMGDAIDLVTNKWSMEKVNPENVKYILFNLSNEEIATRRMDEKNKLNKVYGKNILKTDEDIDNWFASIDTGLENVKKNDTTQLITDAQTATEEDKTVIKTLLSLIDDIVKGDGIVHKDKKKKKNSLKGWEILIEKDENGNIIEDKTLDNIADAFRALNNTPMMMRNGIITQIYAKIGNIVMDMKSETIGSDTRLIKGLYDIIKIILKED